MYLLYLRKYIFFKLPKIQNLIRDLNPYELHIVHISFNITF